MTEEKHAHEVAMKTAIGEVARALQDAFGQKLTAFIAGVADPKTVGRWSRGRSMPRQEAAARLRHAFHVREILKDQVNEETMCAWFIGMNPLLDDSSPAEALAENRFPQVLAAARSFVD
ncbi:XRE family transcriptional regulator [Streptomyces sp. NBC_01261]|uniref:XRE family transcriptional regulator n=1 Tax=Streptomyces sp. NBC_01261 TaxID=2903802 RepID=UPI002E2F9FF8|nr:XRE family transcriptional regulator [Streptomyces sp. NBC_01261]